MIKIEKRLKQEKLQESMEQEVSGKMNRDSRWHDRIYIAVSGRIERRRRRRDGEKERRREGEKERDGEERGLDSREGEERVSSSRVGE